MKEVMPIYGQLRGVVVGVSSGGRHYYSELKIGEEPERHKSTVHPGRAYSYELSGTFTYSRWRFEHTDDIPRNDYHQNLAAKFVPPSGAVCGRYDSSFQADTGSQPDEPHGSTVFWISAAPEDWASMMIVKLSSEVSKLEIRKQSLEQEIAQNKADGLESYLARLPKGRLAYANKKIRLHTVMISHLSRYTEHLIKHHDHLPAPAAVVLETASADGVVA